MDLTSMPRVGAIRGCLGAAGDDSKGMRKHYGDISSATRGARLLAAIKGNEQVPMKCEQQENVQKESRSRVESSVY